MPLIHSEPLFSGYHRPIFTSDPWIRGWWILDDISVSGYDSKNFWDLQVSGSPTQVAGYIRTSGMRFDGVDDALLVDVSTTVGTSTIPIVQPESKSGLWPLEPPHYFGSNDYIGVGAHTPAYGLLMRLKMNEFPGPELTGNGSNADINTYHWTLVSLWNGSGSPNAVDNRYINHLHLTIVNPSSIKLTVQTNSAGTFSHTTFTTYPHTLPSGEWFTIGFRYLGVGIGSNAVTVISGTGPNTRAYFMHGTANVTMAPSGGTEVLPAVSKMAIGCMGPGRGPSGFFKGDIEEIVWYNSAAPTIANIYAFHSGNLQSSRPTFDKLDYPYLTANWRMEGWKSGIAIPGNYGYIVEGQTGIVWWQEQLNNLHVIVSGTVAIDPGSGKIASQTFPVAGPYPGLYGVHYSGISWDSAVSTRFLTRHSKFCPPYMLAPPFGMTIMYWMKQTVNPAANYGVIGFNNRTSTARNAPWNIVWLANATKLTTSHIVYGDNNSTSLSSIAAFGTVDAYASGLWRHVAHVLDFNTQSHMSYISGLQGGLVANNNDADLSGQWLFQTYSNATEPSFTFFSDLETALSQGSPSGSFDEVIIVGDVLPSSTIYNFYTQNSGFLRPLSPTSSGEIGGYLNGIPIPTSSGYIGGYLSGIPLYSSGYIGGYLFGVYNNSGLIGGYLNGISLEKPVSGLIGGYLRGLTSGNSLIGGYIRGQLPTQTQSGIIGGYMAGVEDVALNATFYAFFNVIGRDKKEFDAAATIFKEAKTEFDARAIVYIEERYPTCTIINPAVDQSGNSTPVTYQFEATASGLDNKQIVFTQWFFSDIPITSGSIISSSGTYQTSHTFSKSGLFDVIFIAIDDKGLVTSDRRKINTASGITLPTITLTATTQSGVAPLDVGFSGVINTAPALIKDKFIYFGDNTMSVSTDSVYKLYIVPGIYIPIFRVRDNRGVIVTDSLVIGVNN